MTNTAKKPAKKSDASDLDLDARLDSATATLYLDDEPVEGDMLDQVLAKAKKELDAVLPEPDEIDLDAVLNLPEIDDLKLNDIEDAIPLQSESLKALDNQLTAAMETPSVSDEEIDELLGGAGYDFDSLLGDADDELELTPDEAQLHEDSLLAAVDELLNFGVEKIVEPEVLDSIESNDEVVEFDIDLEEIEEINDEALVAEETIIEPDTEIKPELDNAEIESEPELDELEIETKSELETKDTDLNFEFEDDGFLEPEISTAIEDFIDTAAEQENEIDFEEAFAELNEPEEMAVNEVELTVEPEAALDDLVDSVPFEDTLKIDDKTVEVEDVLVEEFNNFDDVADMSAPLVEISLPSDEELDLAQQLDGLNDAMENKTETAAGFDLLDDDAATNEKVTPTPDANDDDLDWMKQLDDLDATEAPISPVNFEKSEDADTVAENDSETDWMKQLDDLDAADESTSSQIAEPTVDASDDDDWMKQLDNLDAEEPVSAVNLEKDDDQETLASDDDDWMPQLDDHGATDESEEPVADSSDDDDWMAQLGGMDESTDTNETSVDSNFNIADADEESKSFSADIDEDAIIAKAAQAAIAQFKEEQDITISVLKENQDLAFSQLRADQDTLESKNRKQFADAENGRKKTAVFSYAALGVGVLGLLGSGAMGYLAYNNKAETQTLTQSVAELEETVNGIVSKAPEKEKEIAGIKTSVEQLNQKVDKLVAAQVAAAPVATDVTTKNGEVGKVDSAKIGVATSKTSVPAVTNGKIDSSVVEAPKLTETEIVPPVDISPAHPVGEAKTDTKLSDMAKKSADEAKEKAEKAAVTKAKAESDKAKAKEEAALLTEKLTKLSSIAKAASATTKTDEQRKLLSENSASRYKGKMTRGMARGIEKERSESKNVTAKTDGKTTKNTKEILNTAVKQPKAAPVGKYSVNVISYQQEWFAQSKAAEFRQKGIPVEVAPVDPNNYATKYRLKVGGFKNKADADSYAKKIRKEHGLNDAWIGSN